VFLELLRCLLDKLNGLVVYFEQENFDYAYIIPKLQRTYKFWGQYILKEEFLELESLFSVPTKDMQKFQTYLKSDEEFIETFNEKYDSFQVYEQRLGKEFLSKLYQVAKDFIVEAFIKMKEYLPLQDEMLLNCEVLSMTKMDKQKWFGLAKFFSNIVKSSEFISFQHQMELFEEEYGALKEEFSKTSNKLTFWNSLGAEYSLIKKLTITLFTLNYSTVGIERTFSMLTDIKTMKRNRLTVDSVEAILLIRSTLNEQEGLNITEEMIQNYTKLWKTQKNERQEKDMNNDIQSKNDESLKQLPPNVSDINQSNSASRKYATKRASTSKLENDELKKTKRSLSQ